MTNQFVSDEDAFAAWLTQPPLRRRPYLWPIDRTRLPPKAVWK